jgi:hypothetical protein
MIPFKPSIEAALAHYRSPWLLRLHQFDAIEVHPCHAVGCADGTVFIEQCEPDEAHFWSVYCHCLWGGVTVSRIFRPSAPPRTSRRCCAGGTRIFAMTGNPR